jgi:hypothetical protein
VPSVQLSDHLPLVFDFEVTAALDAAQAHSVHRVEA